MTTTARNACTAAADVNVSETELIDYLMYSKFSPEAIAERVAARRAHINKTSCCPSILNIVLAVFAL